MHERSREREYGHGHSKHYNYNNRRDYQRQQYPNSGGYSQYDQYDSRHPHRYDREPDKYRNDRFDQKPAFYQKQRDRNYPQNNHNRTDQRLRLPAPPKITRVTTPYIIKITHDLPFEKVSQVGEGTYGKVYKAIRIDPKTTENSKKNDEFVALKRIRLEAEKEGISITTIREIRLLTTLSHKNIIRLLSLHSSIYEDNAVFLYMAFEYMTHDLTGLLSKTEFSVSQIKNVILQLMDGLSYLHEKDIVHRDVKGSNLLLKDGVVKIADFGLARKFVQNTRNVIPKNDEDTGQENKSFEYTNRVITLWYRPPELLLGATRYDTKIDIWSAGCVFLELFTRKPVFCGKDEVTQLEKIFRILGTPTSPSTVEYYSELPWWEVMKPKSDLTSVLDEKYLEIVGDAMPILKHMLSLYPTERPTAKQVMSDEWFKATPRACKNQELPRVPGEWHEYESKKREKTEKEEEKSVKTDFGNPANTTTPTGGSAIVSRRESFYGRDKGDRYSESSSRFHGEQDVKRTRSPSPYSRKRKDYHSYNNWNNDKGFARPGTPPSYSHNSRHGEYSTPFRWRNNNGVDQFGRSERK